METVACVLATFDLGQPQLSLAFGTSPRIRLLMVQYFTNCCVGIYGLAFVARRSANMSDDTHDRDALGPC